MAGPNLYDQIINGTFDAIGAPPSYISPPYNPADYASIYATPQQTYQPGMMGRGLPTSLGTASALAAADRLSSSSPGLPLNPTGQYNAGNPFVLSALTAQQKGGGKPVAVAQAPSWANPPGFAPRYPVTATPEIKTAYADMVAGKPGAQKRYASLLADAAPTMGKGPAAPAKVAPARTGGGGLLDLLFGGETSGGGLASLLNNRQPYNGRYTQAELSAREAQGQAIGDANRRNPNPTYTVSGDRNDFQPTSVQNSLRWQTGY